MEIKQLIKCFLHKPKECNFAPLSPMWEHGSSPSHQCWNRWWVSKQLNSFEPTTVAKSASPGLLRYPVSKLMKKVTKWWSSIFLMLRTLMELLILEWLSTIELFLLILHDCNLATVKYCNINIWYAWCLVKSPQSGHNPQAENHCNRGRDLILTSDHYMCTIGEHTFMYRCTHTHVHTQIHIPHTQSQRKRKYNYLCIIRKKSYVEIFRVSMILIYENLLITGKYNQYISYKIDSFSL